MDCVDVWTGIRTQVSLRYWSLSPADSAAIVPILRRVHLSASSQLSKRLDPLDPFQIHKFQTCSIKLSESFGSSYFFQIKPAAVFPFPLITFSIDVFDFNPTHLAASAILS